MKNTLLFHHLILKAVTHKYSLALIALISVVSDILPPAH
jgi:hypothetical protein